MTADQLNEYSKLRDRTSAKIDAIQSALQQIKRIASANMDKISFEELSLSELKRIEREMDSLSGILNSITAL